MHNPLHPERTNTELPLLRAVLDSAAVPIFSRDDGGRIVTWNVAAERVFGYTEAEALGTTIELLAPDEGSAAYSALADEVRREGLVVGRPVLRRHKDGHFVGVSLWITPMRAINGSPAGLVFVVTEAEQEVTDLIVAEERLRNLVESIPNAVLAIAEDGRIVYGNALATDLFGYPYDELLGLTADDLVPERFGPGRHADLRDEYAEETYAPRIMGAGREMFARRKDGTEVEVEIGLSAFVAGGERFVTAVIADITERRSLERQLTQAQKAESVARLASGVAHDFNNILTTIAGYTSLLRMRVAPSEHADLDAITLATDRAANLTRQLFALSRPQHNVSQVVDLNALIGGLRPMLEILLGEHVRLVVNLSDEIPAIAGDPSQFEQILMNLVGNARDAMPDGGTVTIAIDVGDLGPEKARARGLTLGRYVSLSVADTGMGMTEETRAHLFEPFYTTKSPDKGTGLGLATVYGIVRQGNGNIWVNSEVGKGTVFKIYVPAVGDAQRQAASATSGPVVLLVEDDPLVRNMERSYLSQRGYRVLAAASAEEALAVAASDPDPIEILVSDVVMPGIHGPELARRLRAMIPDLSVLLVSGHIRDWVDIEKGDQTMAFLAKPFGPETLESMIAALLAARATRVHGTDERPEGIESEQPSERSRLDAPDRALPPGA